MEKNYSPILTFTILFKCTTIFAQCPIGQMDIKIDVETDTYGYELYWELVPFGNDCGDGAIFVGGNETQIGCSGGGDGDATTAYGYDDNAVITAEIGCVDEGFYDIKYVDDYGDGGGHFNILLNDLYPMYSFTGSGAEATFSFEVIAPPNFDAGVISLTTNPYANLGVVQIAGELFNFGATTINSIVVNYTINGGTPISSTISGLAILPFSEADFVHPIAWNPAENGVYDVRLFSSEINGNADLVIENDSAQKLIVIGDPVPNIIIDYINFIEDYEVIGNSSDEIKDPTDLDFHPILSDYQVWVVNKSSESMGGSTVTFWNAGQSDQISEYKKDANSYHFMSLPTGIAFSENTNFATSPGVKDANHSGGTFTGPTLWSSDISIYAEPSGGNGSHLDMLHQSPFSMGIAAWKENAFFVFCDWHGYVHMYDFVDDHGPGNDDHSDGMVWEYLDFNIEMINDDLPSHLVYDKNSNYLYTIDAGNGRIIRMNPESGEVTGTFPHTNEPLAEAFEIENTDWVEIVSEGLVEPVGIDVIGNYMLVSEHATGEIIIYDITTVPAVELKRLQTERDGLMGIKIGPDGLIWFVDQDEDELVRINITNALSISDQNLVNTVEVYPNPSNGYFMLSFNNKSNKSIAEISIINQIGETIFSMENINADKLPVNISKFAAGTYTLKVQTTNDLLSQKLIIIK